MYETVQILGYHRLGDLYSAGRRPTGERALKEGAPTHKPWRPSTRHKISGCAGRRVEGSRQLTHRVERVV